jgi:hypothetical protein
MNHEQVRCPDCGSRTPREYVDELDGRLFLDCGHSVPAGEVPEAREEP